jgi:hypothetical protein
MGKAENVQKLKGGRRQAQQYEKHQSLSTYSPQVPEAHDTNIEPFSFRVSLVYLFPGRWLETVLTGTLACIRLRPSYTNHNISARTKHVGTQTTDKEMRKEA